MRPRFEAGDSLQSKFIGHRHSRGLFKILRAEHASHLKRSLQNFHKNYPYGIGHKLKE